MKIKELVPIYLRHLHAIGRSEVTIKGRRYDLNEFMKFLEEEEISYLEDLTEEVMAEYQQELSFRLTAKGKLLAIRTQGQLLGVAKGFTKFLKAQDYLLNDPGRKIKLPKKPKRLPTSATKS